MIDDPVAAASEGVDPLLVVSPSGGAGATTPSEAAAAARRLRADLAVATVEDAVACLAERAFATVVLPAVLLRDDPDRVVADLVGCRPDVAVVATGAAGAEVASLLAAGVDEVVEGAGPAAVRAAAGRAAARSAAERAQRRLARRYRLLHQHAVERFAIVDGEGMVLERGGRAAAPASPAVGDDLLGWVTAGSRARVARTLAEVAVLPGSTCEVEAEVVDDPGGSRWVTLRVTNLRDEDAIAGLAVGIWDVTERVEALARRELAEHRFLAAFRASHFGMYMADLGGVVTAVNPALCRLLDRPPEELVGHRFADFADPDDVVADAVGFEPGDEVESFSEERRYLRPDGSGAWLEHSVTQVRDSDGGAGYYMAQLHDVTDRRRVEEALARRTLYDDLTGLASRTLLTDRMEHALAVGRWGGTRTGVAFVALDGFKHVNDAFGHVAGDQLLVAVGERLAGVVAPIDTVARFAGDIYVVVSPDASTESMGRLASQVAEDLARPYRLGDREVTVRASLGITLSREGGSSGESLLSEAGAAMHRAKELGRDRTVVFDDSLTTRAAAFLSGESALRAALDASEIVAWYQPIVDLRSGRVVAAEALARWVGADGGIVPPGEFVPLAERTGLIVDVGRAVLTGAAAAAARWNAGRDRPVAVSVNLSARQVSDERVVASVADVLGATGLDPSLLQLEITETAVIEDLTHTLPILCGLRDLGVRLAIDDFGTGYSSLSYLKRLPVDTVKIDRSFVSDVGVSTDDRSIVEAIIALSRALGLRCLAEGVEEAAQRDVLIGLGCQLGQGFLWSPAVPEAEVGRLLAGPGDPPPPPG